MQVYPCNVSVYFYVSRYTDVYILICIDIYISIYTYLILHVRLYCQWQWQFVVGVVVAVVAAAMAVDHAGVIVVVVAVVVVRVAQKLSIEWIKVEDMCRCIHVPLWLSMYICIYTYDWGRFRRRRGSYFTVSLGDRGGGGGGDGLFPLFPLFNGRPAGPVKKVK